MAGKVHYTVATAMKRTNITVLISLLVLFYAASVWADNIVWAEDPATLHIGLGAYSGVTCSNGTDAAMGCGGDPNIVQTNGHFDIFQNTGGNIASLKQPVLLILGVPNVTASNFFSNNSISSVFSVNQYTGNSSIDPAPVAGTATFGNASPIYGWSGSGYAGTFSAANTTDIYSVLGLTPYDNSSNHFYSWAAASAGITGQAVQQFGIYVFAIDADLGPKGLIDIQFNTGAVPTGTIAVAYGQTQDTVCKRGGCTTTITPYDTPWTEAGLESLPEPGSLQLLGAGAVVLCGLIRRLRK